MFGSAEKLVKDVFHLWVRTFVKKQILFLETTKKANNHFWVLTLKILWVFSIKTTLEKP